MIKSIWFDERSFLSITTLSTVAIGKFCKCWYFHSRKCNFLSVKSQFMYNTTLKYVLHLNNLENWCVWAARTSSLHVVYVVAVRPINIRPYRVIHISNHLYLGYQQCIPQSDLWNKFQIHIFMTEHFMIDLCSWCGDQAFVTTTCFCWWNEVMERG